MERQHHIPDHAFAIGLRLVEPEPRTMSGRELWLEVADVTRKIAEFHSRGSELADAAAEQLEPRHDALKAELSARLWSALGITGPELAEVLS